MRKILLVLPTLLLAAPLFAAQSEPATWGGSNASTPAAQPSSSSVSNLLQKPASTAKQNPQDLPEQKEMEKVAFARRRSLPENPKPKQKHADENAACPSGEGNPCALLGGWRYYSDQWHLTQHQATWWQAYKTPGMLFSTTMLFASTAVDIEGTQHCLAAGTCRELNPIIGKTRARQYGVAMPMDALVAWIAVREKQRGRGVLPFFMLWTVSTVHLYYGANGLTPQHHP